MDSGIMVSDSAQASGLRTSIMVKSSPDTILLLNSSTVIRSELFIADSPEFRNHRCRKPQARKDVFTGSQNSTSSFARNGELCRCRLGFGRNNVRGCTRFEFGIQWWYNIRVRARLRLRIRFRSWLTWTWRNGWRYPAQRVSTTAATHVCG